LADLSKNDIFYDVGCGDGFVCIQAARRCKCSVGIEDLKIRAKRAARNVSKSGLSNVKIIPKKYQKVRIRGRNIVLFTVNDLSFEDFEKWNRRSDGRNFRIVTYGPPAVPIKPAAKKGSFFLTKFPYSLAKTDAELCYAVTRKRNASLKHVIRKLKSVFEPDDLRQYVKDFRRHFR